MNATTQQEPPAQPEIQSYLSQLHLLNPHQQQEILSLLGKIEQSTKQQKARVDFIAFVRSVWPGFIEGRHHRIMADAFQRVVSGKLKRLIINMPPRHTKSEFASYLLVAWFLGLAPAKKVIQSSHTSDLATGFGRKVRNLIGAPEYQQVFPGVRLAIDNKAAGRWNTNKGGEYYAIGVGGGVTGKGADLFIIDDPHSEQEAKLAQFKPEIFDQAYEWYTSGPRQRLQPDAAIVIVACMTGDTAVLMADGIEKPLREVRPSDEVATYDNGMLTSAKVLNWRSNGVDSIYKIRTQSGRILHANERHPFLVDDNGECRWIRLRDLRPGMWLVATKAVHAQQNHKQNRGCALPANPQSRTTKNILMRLTTLLDIMASGKGKLVRMTAAQDQSQAKGCAARITTNFVGHQGFENFRAPRKRSAMPALNIVTELLKRILTGFCAINTAFARYVGNLLQSITPALTGTISCASITTILQGVSGDCSAMIATSRLGMQKQQLRQMQLRGISDFTKDQITEIVPAGEEEVFDVEIERTENFIANGVVSHNTRWGKRDLCGQILKASQTKGIGDEWEVIELPAVLPSGSSLWPEFWPIEQLLAVKADIPTSKWNAQYQQNPTSEEGAIVKREWWKIWQPDDPPSNIEFIIQCWDTAFTQKTNANYSACTTWGIFQRETVNGEKTTTASNIILLDAFRKRMDFPDLKTEAMRQYKYWKPDAFIVEAKASGGPLIFELRSMGIPVSDFTPTRGTKGAPNDKIARLNGVSDIFRSGLVWAPDRKWAEEVVNEVAEQPNSEFDDLSDTVVMAMMRYRQGGFLRLDNDEDEEDREKFPHRRRRNYY